MGLFGKEMTLDEALDTLFDSNASKGACKKAAKMLDGVHVPYNLQGIGVILGNIRGVYNKDGAAGRAYIQIQLLQGDAEKDKDTQTLALLDRVRCAYVTGLFFGAESDMGDYLASYFLAQRCAAGWGMKSNPELAQKALKAAEENGAPKDSLEKMRRKIDLLIDGTKTDAAQTTDAQKKSAVSESATAPKTVDTIFCKVLVEDKPTSVAAEKATTMHKEYPDGVVYDGEISDGKQDGFGKMVFTNGDFVEGFYKNNAYHGVMLYTFANGSKQLMLYNMNKELERLAVEKTFTADIEKYRDIDVTSFKLQAVVIDSARTKVMETDNKPTPVAPKTVDTIFCKVLVEDKPTSVAAEKATTMHKEYPDGVVYDGEISDGKQDGFGKMVFTNGDFVEGFYKNNAYHGVMLYTFANGSKQLMLYNMNKELERLAVEKTFMVDFEKYRDIDVTSFKLQAVVIDSARTKVMETDNKPTPVAPKTIDTLFGKVLVADKPAGKTEFQRIDGRNGCYYEGETVDGKKHGKGKFVDPGRFRIFIGEYRDGIKASGIVVFINPENNELFDARKETFAADGTKETAVRIKGEEAMQAYAEAVKDTVFDKSVAPSPVKTEHKRIEFDNGDVYEGEYLNGKKYGKGKYSFANGDVYEGEWKDNKKHGKGKYTSAQGWVYEGDYVNGHSDGYGKITFSSGDVYEGEWRDDKKHGRGKYVSAQGWVYEGDYANGHSDGYGKITLSTGDVYEGEFLNGKKNGKGKYTFKNGDVYDGGWKEDKKHGFGKYVATAGGSYEGDWADDVFHGHGRYVFKDGAVHEGEFKEGKMTGKGKRAHADGTHYDGDWLNGKKHGHGILKTVYLGVKTMRECFEGEWVDGLREGAFKHSFYYTDSGRTQFIDTAHFKHDERVYGTTVSNVNTKDFVIDCNDKAMQALENRDYFRCSYYLHLGGLFGEYYKYALGECYDPDGIKGYRYVEKILLEKKLKDISVSELSLCKFVLEKFIPKNTGHSRAFLAWCHYCLGDTKKAAGLIYESVRVLMVYEGKVREVNEVFGIKATAPFPYSDEIMADRYLEKADKDMLLKGYSKEKILIAEEYVNCARRSGLSYRLDSVEHHLNDLKCRLQRKL